MTSRLSALGLIALIVLTPMPPVSGQISDTTPPQLASFTFSPSAIDVTAASQAVTATMRITDDLTGVAGVVGPVVVQFASPTGAQTKFALPTRIACTVPNGSNCLDGTWEGTATFPQFIESGTWKVLFVSLRDAVSNQAVLNTVTLQAMGFPTDLTVASNPDISPPQLTSLVLSPASIDVSSGPQTVTITLGLSDNPAGADFFLGGTVILDVFRIMSPSGPSGRQRHIRSNRAFTLVAGTPQNGTWEAQFSMPQYSAAGTWKVEFLQFQDLAANRAFLDTAAIQALGFSPNLNVTSVPSDTSAPQLVSFAFTPALVDTSLASQMVTVALGTTDNLSGVSFSGVDPLDPALFPPCFFGVQFRSPSGAQRQPSFFVPTLVSGTALNGVWSGSVTFPQLSEAGTWKVERLGLRDVTNNCLFLNTTALQGLGFPTDLIVVQPSQIPDGMISNPAAGGTVMDTVFGSSAQITFPPGVLSAPTEVAIDVFQSPLAIPTPTGFSGPGTRFVNISLTPPPSFPLPAPGLTVVLPLVNPLPPGTSINLFRVDASTGTLVPALNTSGEPVIGTVDPSGLTATFAGVARLSIVVGLLPGNRPPVANAGVNRTLECTSSVGTAVTLDGSASSDPDGDPLTFQWKNAVGVVVGTTPIINLTLPLGSHTFTLTVSDGKGGTDSASVTIMIRDTSPPQLSFSLSPNILSPPNHRLAPVTAAMQRSDACDSNPGIVLVSITSNEPDNGPDDGDTPNDIQEASFGTDDRSFLLRAERSGTGTGRIYTVMYRAMDASGNTTMATRTVIVPLNQSH